MGDPETVCLQDMDPVFSAEGAVLIVVEGMNYRDCKGRALFSGGKVHRVRMAVVTVAMAAQHLAGGKRKGRKSRDGIRGRRDQGQWNSRLLRRKNRNVRAM